MEHQDQCRKNVGKDGISIFHQQPKIGIEDDKEEAPFDQFDQRSKH